MINVLLGSGVGCLVMDVGESEEPIFGAAVGRVSVGAKVMINQGNKIAMRESKSRWTCKLEHRCGIGC